MTARLAIVKQHIQSENRHDLNELMKTFGQNAHYDDVPCTHVGTLNGSRIIGMFETDGRHTLLTLSFEARAELQRFA